MTKKEKTMEEQLNEDIAAEKALEQEAEEAEKAKKNQKRWYIVHTYSGYENKVKVNLMQNSAISFSLCFDENRNILPQLLDDLQEYYNVKYNISLQLITLRHYTPEAVESVLRNKKILIEQKNRTTAQFLVEDIE